MKSRLLIIITITSIVLLVTPFSYGTWGEQPLEELWEQSQTIFVGNVTSVQVVDVEKTAQYSEETDGVEKNIVKNYTMHLDEYTIEIDNFLKNTQNFDIITVREPTVSAGIYQSTIGGFEIGDYVLFYIENLNDINTYSPESQTIRTDNQLFYFQDEFKKFSYAEVDKGYYVDFRDADDEIIERGCIVALRGSVADSFADQFSYMIQCHPFTVFLIFLILSSVIIGLVFVVWRKRK